MELILLEVQIAFTKVLVSQTVKTQPPCILPGPQLLEFMNIIKTSTILPLNQPVSKFYFFFANNSHVYFPHKNVRRSFASTSWF